MSVAGLVMLKNAIFDKLIGCKTTERAAYYVQEQQVWRETEFYCERCGKFFFRAQRRVTADEFWEDDSYYVLPLADSVADAS
ncbi:MAG TPA: hypothetical protein VFD58_35925 [Blastocatellia bacterium]|nr:hypothetical protein [Blastocatellia bacterium]